MAKKLLFLGMLGIVLAFAVPATVFAQDFTGGTILAQTTGSGIKNYVVTIEGWWVGPAGDPRARTPVYGTYSISARSESEALSEARSRFKNQYPQYRIIDESVKRK